MPEHILDLLNQCSDDTEIVYRSSTHADTAIKYVGKAEDGRVGGYLVVWGSPAQKDLTGEYFTPETELGLDWYDQRPVLYHHGLDGDLKASVIGVIDTLKADRVGLWAEAQLDMRQRYIQAVRRLIDKGVLGWSSGSLPHLVEVDSDGRIKRWPIVEGSLTPTPAEPRQTDVRTIKSALLALHEPEEPPAKEEVPAHEEDAPPNQPINQHVEGVKIMNPQEILAIALDALVEASGAQLDEQQRADLLQRAMALVEERMGQMQSAEGATAAAPDGGDGTGSNSVTLEIVARKAVEEPEFIAQLAEMIREANKAHAADADAIKANILKMAKTLPGKSKVTNFTGQYNQGGQRAPAHIPNLRLRAKYANLSPETMSFIVDTYRQYHFKTSGYGPYVPPGVDFGASPEDAIKTFMQELADKALEQQQKQKLYLDVSGLEAASAIKSMKANELDHTTQATFGQEWVHTIWRNQIWDRARLDNVVLSQFESIEMAAKVEELPLEKTDPEVYFVPESTADSELDPSASPTPSSKIGTGKATFNAKKLALRVGWSAEEDEDSIIRFADRARRQSERAMMDGIDFVLLNGDTETGSTNINFDGSAPAAKSKFLALNGLIKMAIVTNTDLRLDASGLAPTLANIRQTRFKMGREQAPKVDDIVLFTHTEPYQPMLGIDEFLTMDKAGPMATALKGQLGLIDGTPVLVTAQILLSASNGKVHNATGNNFGRIVEVYKPNWLVGFRRAVIANLEFLPGAEAWQLHMSTRLDFQSSTTDSVSVLYDLGV